MLSAKSPTAVGWAGLCWAGLGWAWLVLVGLGWDGMGCAGLGWAEVGCADVGWAVLCVAGLDCAGLGWAGLCWAVLGCAGLCWAMLGWAWLGSTVLVLARFSIVLDCVRLCSLWWFDLDYFRICFDKAGVYFGAPTEPIKNDQVGLCVLRIAFRRFLIAPRWALVNLHKCSRKVLLCLTRKHNQLGVARCAGLGCAGLCWIVPGWAVLGWLGWAWLGCAVLGWAVLDCVRLGSLWARLGIFGELL